MRNTLLVISLVLLAACEGTQDVKSHFTVVNPTTSSITLIIQGEEINKMIPPNGSAEFDHKVDVPTPTNGGTEPQDRFVSIPIAVHDLTMNIVTPVVYCTAGMHSITNIEYRIYGTAPYLSPLVSCGTTYGRLPIATEIK